MKQPSKLDKTIIGGMLYGLKMTTPLGVMQITSVDTTNRFAKYWFGYDHKIKSKHFNAEICLKNGLVSKGFKSNEIKPHLFNLSDLVNPITLNGETLIFANFYMSQSQISGIKSAINLNQNPLDYIDGSLYLKMCEFHFNIYGLDESEYINATESQVYK